MLKSILVQWNIIVMSVLHLNTQARTKTHTRVPLEKMASSTSLPECSKHKLPKQIFCFDENVLICHQCRDEDHKPPHKTKLVVDCEKDIKNELKASVAVLTDLKELEKEEMI
jgi:hypothetical protein